QPELCRDRGQHHPEPGQRGAVRQDALLSAPGLTRGGAPGDGAHRAAAARSAHQALQLRRADATLLMAALSIRACAALAYGPREHAPRPDRAGWPWAADRWGRATPRGAALPPLARIAAGPPARCPG